MHHWVGTQRHQCGLMKVPMKSVVVLRVHRVHSMWVVVMVVMRLVWVKVRVVSHVWVHHMCHVAVHGSVAYMTVTVIVDSQRTPVVLAVVKHG